MPASTPPPGLLRFRRVHINVNLRMRMREIEFYVSASGRCPVKEFLDGLPTRQARKVWSVLDTVGSLEVVPVQFLKKLAGTDGLWEVRAQQGGRAFRLLGFFAGSRLVVLVSGFVKKTEELPLHEVALAQRRRREYWERNGTHG